MAGSVSIQNWFANKSVKLSDSFIVEFDGNESFRCAGFSIPKVAEWNEEVHKFGNTSHKVLIPKIDMLQELTVELFEGYTSMTSGGETLKTACQSFFWKIAQGGFTNGRGFTNYADYDSSGYNHLKGVYSTKKPDFDKVTIYILNNRLNKVVYKYEFFDLYLTKYTPYELSYSDESITKWSLSFVFSKFIKSVPDDPDDGVVK